MRQRSTILKAAVFFLLLVFLQKSGVGLFLHNAFHSQSNAAFPDEKSRELSFACTCIDDFMLPYEAAPDVAVTSPLTSYPDPQPHAAVAIPFRYTVHSLLRGPPAQVL